MAIINQDWISEGINACTTIKAYVPKTTDYSTIAGHFVGLKQDTASPAISTATSATPVGVVLEKLDDMYDPFLGDDRSGSKNYMVRLQISGIAAVNYSGSIPTVGSFAQLGPDGNGGVKTVESGGRPYLVVGANTITKQIWIVL